MLRSDAESSSLKTYRPAGKTLPPGISTRLLNVTIVFWFESSDFTLGGNTKATRTKQEIIAITLHRFILDNAQESQTDLCPRQIVCPVSFERGRLRVCSKLLRSTILVLWPFRRSGRRVFCK